jgi:hypothetical protein
MEAYQAAVLIFGSSVHLFLLGMVGFTYHRRKVYLPFVIKQTGLLFLSVIFGILWWIGNAITLTLIKIPATTGTCTALFHFVPQVFGVNAYISVLIYRTLRVYYAAVKIKRINKTFYGVLFAQYVPALIGAVWTLVDWDNAVVAHLGYTCYYKSRILLVYVYLTIAWQMAFLAILNYKCYQVVPAANEYKECKIILIANVLIMLLTIPFVFFKWTAFWWGVVAVNMSVLVTSSLFVVVCLSGTVYG